MPGGEGETFHSELWKSDFCVELILGASGIFWQGFWGRWHCRWLYRRRNSLADISGDKRAHWSAYDWLWSQESHIQTAPGQVLERTQPIPQLYGPVHDCSVVLQWWTESSHRRIDRFFGRRRKSENNSGKSRQVLPRRGVSSKIFCQKQRRWRRRRRVSDSVIGTDSRKESKKQKQNKRTAGIKRGKQQQQQQQQLLWSCGFMFTQTCIKHENLWRSLFTFSNS